ncbi:MAG: acetyl-CoA carboxylase biotin carboxyl carrier protein [Bacteriovoracales bacterium]|nr:acetyl-CoA carboxylase biotin carboxyl carrier protein [Bacteriovoracales bacterium]
MDVKKIKQMIKLAKEEEVAKLEFENDDFKCSVTLPPGSLVGETRDIQRDIKDSLLSSEKTKGEQEKNLSKTQSDDHIIEVKSPFVGTFYRAPSPDNAPFVQVGDKVSVGQTLCILEAMKIMNEIEAEVAGEIVEICAENEGLVEYDQILFKIRK